MRYHRRVYDDIFWIAVAFAFAILLGLLRPAFGQDRIDSYRVVDGDTIHATVDIGWNTLVRAKIRLNGLYAPERNEPGGPEATQALKDTLAAAKVITVVPTGKKSFDRWVADVYVDGDNVLTHVGPPVVAAEALVPMAAEIDSTPWQLETQAKLDAAGDIALASNRSIVVTEQPGKYEFVSLDIPPHVYLVFGTGLASREGDLVYVGGDNPDKPLVTVRGGYSGGVAGCQIRDRTNNHSGLIGIKVENCTNPSISNIRIDLRGKDTIGLQIAGRESLTVSRMEARSSVPVQYVWGDNIALHDCDLGATGTNEVLPRCIFHLAGLPHQITVDGATTAQGGDYLVYGKTPDQSTTGQILILQGIRWEQSTSANDPNIPGIYIECQGRAFEGLIQFGCRWSPRKNIDTLIVTNPAYPVIPKLTEIGNFKPKK